jgi:hypothetical protein
MGVESRLKTIALTLARPLSRRIWARIEMQIARADRGEQLLQRHPAAFLDAVSTVAALGRQVRQLQKQVAALQQRQPIEISGDAVELSLSTDDAVTVDRLLQAVRPALRTGATVQLRLRGQAVTPDVLEIASAAAAWLRGNDFTDVKISADTASPAITVSARLAA